MTVGYESHETMSVELDVGDLRGDALFEWFVSSPDGGFWRRFNALGDWIAHVAAYVRAGSCVRREDKLGPWLLVPETTPPVPRPHPWYGHSTHVGADILAWPEHWQRANGLSPSDLVLRGATHTVAEVFASSAAELHATVAGKVVDLAGGPSGMRVRVDDGTGRLDISCPRETTLLGPRLGDWFEFDVVVAAGERQVPPDPEAAAAGIEDPVERTAALLSARYGGPVGATATAVRRMPPAARRVAGGPPAS